MSVHTTPALPRLSVLDLSRLKWLLGNSLAFLSIWSVLSIDVSAEPLLAGVGLIIALFTWRPALMESLPDLVVSVVFPVALTAIILIDFSLSQPDIVPPLVRMLLLLILFRCVSNRRRREDLQLVLMCLFMVMLVGVLTLSLSFGVQILLFTPFAMIILFLITLTEPANRGYTPTGMDYQWEAFHWRSFAFRVWRAQNVRVAGIVTGLFFLVLAVSAAIFLTIPRFQINQAIPFLNVNVTRSLSGFSDRIVFGEVVEILEDDQVALRVDAPDRTRIPVGPYWRMVVLDSYQNGVFQMSDGLQYRNNAIRTARFNPDTFPRFDQNIAQTWTFYLEGGVSRYLPLVGRVSEIRFQERQRIEYNAETQVVATQRISGKALFYQTEGDITEERFPASPLDRQLIGARSIPMTLEGRLADGAVPYPYTTLIVPEHPADLRILDAQIQEITGGRPLSPEAFAGAAVSYLKRRHGYSLQTRIPDGDGDLMTRWLSSNQPGHCELFAGAFTLLARRAGYPTRIVTGFRDGLWNGYEQYYMVRNKDAHAWCEMFDGGDYWFQVDPTPPADGDANLAGTPREGFIDRTWGAYFDSLRIIWYRRVIKFDRAQQRELTGRIRSAGLGLIAGLRARARQEIQAMRDTLSGVTGDGLWRLSLRFALLGGALFLVWRYGPGLIRRMSHRRASTAFIDPIRRRAGIWLFRMNEARGGAGHRPASEWTPWSQTHHDLLRIRYGRTDDWPEPEPVFRQARRLIRARPRRDA